MGLPSLKFPTLKYSDQGEERKPTATMTLDYPEWQPTTPGLRVLKAMGSSPPVSSVTQNLINDILYGSGDKLDAGVSGYLQSTIEGVEKGTIPKTALIPTKLSQYSGGAEAIGNQPPSFWQKTNIVVNEIGKLPEYLAAKVITAIKGEEGADVVDRGWTYRFLKDLKEDREKAMVEMYKKYGTTEIFKGIELGDIKDYIDSLSYSVTSATGGLAVGLSTGLMSPAVGWVAGGATSGKIAYEMTSYELMQEYLEIKDEQMRKVAGRGLTLKEQQELKDGFSYLAKKNGLYEAIPEAAGQVFSFKLLASPLIKMFGESIALRLLGKAGAMFGEELTTEAITQMGQMRIRYQAGLPGGEMRDWFSGGDWMKSLKEVAPQTIALTITLGGLGGVAVKTESVIRTLKREVGANTSAFEFYKGKIEVFLNKKTEERKAEIEKQFPGYTLKEPASPFRFGGMIEEIEPIKEIPKELEPLAEEAKKYKSAGVPQLKALTGEAKSAEEFLQNRPNYSIGIGKEKPIFNKNGDKIGRLILNENNKEVQIRDIIRDKEDGKGIPTQIVNDLKEYTTSKNKQLSLSPVVPGAEKYWEGLGFTKDKTGKYFYTQPISLSEQAKKYKSAEEFVEANTLYRSGELREGRKALKGDWFSTTEDYAKLYSDRGELKNYFISPEAKILKYKELPSNMKPYPSGSLQWGDFKDIQELQNKAFNYAKKNGYDAVTWGNKEVNIINSDILITKSQLTDIYNQAVKGVKEPKTLAEEAELSKIYQQQFDEIRSEGEKKIFSDIKDLGGIKTDPSLKEEMSDLPIDIIRTNGLIPDEMMEMLNSQGYNFESVSDLFDSIRSIRSMPSRFRPAESSMEKNLRAIKSIRTKMPKEISESKKLSDLEKEITREITKKRFTLAQRLAQKEKAEVAITKERIVGEQKKEVAVRREQLKTLRAGITQRFKGIQKGLREGRINTKQEIKAVQTELLKILDESNLDLNDKAKFRKAIKNIQTREQLQKMLPEFNERVRTLEEASEVRKLKNQIKELLKNTKPKSQAGKPVGKFTPAVQRVLDAAREAIGLTEKQSEEKIIDNLDRYKEKTMPIEVAIQNRILSMNSQGPEGLRELLAVITEIKETGKMAKALKDFNIQEELDRERNYLIDVVTDYKGIAPGRQTTGKVKLDFKQRAQQTLKSLGQNFILSWNGLMGVLDWHTQVDQKTLAGKYSVLDQENKYKELQEEYIDNFNQMFAEIYKIPQETTKEKVMFTLKINKEIGKLKKEVDLGTFKNNIGQEVEIKINRDEMIKRYMEFQDPTLADSFRDGNNYSEEIKDAITAELTDQEKSLADKQMEIYRDQHAKINPLYRKMYGVDLPFNQFYSPIMREGYKIDTKEGFQTFLDEASYRKAVTSKSFITRQKNSLPIAKQGSLEALDRHITQTNYFIAWAEKIRQLDSIFADSGVRTAIKEEFGDSLLRQIMKTIEDLAYKRRIRGDIHGSVNWFRKKFTMGALMLKPSLAAKQMVSTAAYLEKLSAVEFTTGILDFWRNPVRNYQTMAKESIFIRSRGKGGEIERDIRAAMTTDVYKRFSTIHSFWDMAMMNIRLGDKGAIVTGAWAMRRAGLNKGQTITEIVREYEEFSSETQQSADISQLSAVQKGGTFSVLFTMFKSSQRQYLAKEVNAVKTLFQKGGTSPKNIAKVARVLAIYHVLLPVLFQWVSNFGGWDEDDRKEYLRAGILGSLNGLFLFGDIVDGIIRAAMGMKTWPQEVPVVTIGTDLQNAVKKLDFDDITAEDVKDALAELTDAGNSLGIPVQYAKNFSMGLKEVTEGDINSGIGLLLGWSPYFLGGGKASKVPAGMKSKPGGSKMPSLKFPNMKGMPSLKFPEMKIK